jgi:hypothetical protein
VQHSIVGERSRLDYGVELQVNYNNFLTENAITKVLNSRCIVIFGNVES